MNQNLERNRFRILGRELIAPLGFLLLTIPVALIFFVVVRVIPPITGCVVDAVSGKPIRDVRLSMEVNRYEGWSIHTELHDVAKSRVFGWFFLSGALRLRGLPLPQFRSYWLTVNEGSAISGQEEVSAATETMYNPMFNRRGAAVGNAKYFPLTVTFRRGGCALAWPATCMHKAFWWGITLPLIPVVEDINDCKKIGDSSLRENCRQLNTYRAAFAHVDSYEDVQRGKELCKEVDHGTISKTCLDQLALYIANPAAYGRTIQTQANDPIPDGMFPESLAGLPVMKNKHCGPRREFTGQLMCAAGYGSETKQLVAVYIEQWPESQQSTKPPDWKPNYTDHEQAVVTEESHRGGKILRYRGPQYNSFYWYSGDRHIEVFFYYPIPRQEQFVSYYMGKFPSTFE